MIPTTDRESVEPNLERLGPLTREQILLPWSRLRLQIDRPADIDALLDLAATDREQNLPYWAEIWPSGLALADAIATWRPAWNGVRVLEVGCGLGTTAIAASRAGADLVVTDYAAEALALCRRNVVLNGVPAPPARQLNWRTPDARGWADLGAPFAVVLAADVLYEQRDMEPLLTFLSSVTRPGGQLWLAEPRRSVALAWLNAADRQGWIAERDEHGGPWPDPKDAGVVVGLHRLRRPG